MTITSENKFISWKNLIDWSKENFSQLPWRQQRSLYKTLVSEFMLQQTTVSTVIPKFQEFITLYPSWDSLASSSLEDVLKLWRGLGYYQRARRLHALVQSVSEEQFCKELTERQWIGIGPYTLHALLAIGLNKPYLAKDANISRILTRLNLSAGSSVINKALLTYSPRAFNEALMDLGRMFCKARVTLCDQCFFQSHCPSAFQPVVANTKLIKKNPIKLIRFIVQTENHEYIGYKKLPHLWLSGYIELPTFLLKDDEDLLLKKQYEVIGDYLEDFIDIENPCQSLKSTITRYTFENQFYLLEEKEFFQLLKKSHKEFSNYKSFDKQAPWSSLSLKIL